MRAKASAHSLVWVANLQIPARGGNRSSTLLQGAWEVALQFIRSQIQLLFYGHYQIVPNFQWECHNDIMPELARSCRWRTSCTPRILYYKKQPSPMPMSEYPLLNQEERDLCLKSLVLCFWHIPSIYRNYMVRSWNGKITLYFVPSGTCSSISSDKAHLLLLWRKLTC